MAMNPYITDLNLIIAFAAALLGFPAGVGVAYLAREEMKDAKKYLPLMMHFLLTIALVILLFNLKLHLAIIMVSSLVLFGALLFVYPSANKTMFLMACYIVMTVIYAFSAKNIFALVFQVSVIFLFGLPAGSLFVQERIFGRHGKLKTEKHKKQVKKRK